MFYSAIYSTELCLAYCCVQVKTHRSATFRKVLDRKKEHFIQYQANTGLYISGPEAISQWKCSKLIYLLCHSYLSSSAMLPTQLTLA